MITTTGETSQTSALKDNFARYIYHDDVLERNILRLLTAIKTHYTNVILGYSFKTNYLWQICDKFRRLGQYAEVVSPAENWYAKSIGFPDSRIIYNGVIPDSSKYLAAKEGAVVNIDSLDEFEAITRMAWIRKDVIHIGVRITFDIGTGITSRFGIDVSDDTFENLMNRIRASSRIAFDGFHCHIGSSRKLQYWKTKMKCLIELAKEYEASYIDAGGRMFGDMPEELAAQFDGYCSYEEYGDLIGGMMKEAFPQEEVKLFLEPGTPVVGNAIDVIADVISIRRIGGKWYAILDCSCSDLGYICECKELPVTVTHTGTQSPIHYDDIALTGYTCLEGDILRPHYSGKLAVGDEVRFSNCGAYSLSNERQFIGPRLAVYDDRGKTLLGEESNCDMFGRYL